jgi:hypothetical protein
VDAALKAIVEYGITLVALFAVSWLVFWLIGKLLSAKDSEIADLRKQRDFNGAGWQASITAVERLTDGLRERNDIIDRLMGTGR